MTIPLTAKTTKKLDDAAVSAISRLRAALFAVSAAVIVLAPTFAAAQLAGPVPNSDRRFGLAAPAPGAAQLSDEEQIRELISRYARAADTRDADAFRQIFTPDLATQNFVRQLDGALVSSNTQSGHSIEVFMGGLAKLVEHPHDFRVHHFTHDPLIEIHGDVAYMNTQFLVTASTPLKVIPEGATGDMGTVTTTLTGYYDDVLRKTNGRWYISEHRVIVDFPFVFPK